MNKRLTTVSGKQEPLRILLMPALSPAAEPFIKLFTGFANTDGGGGNVVKSWAGCDMVTPVMLFVTYMGLVAYMAVGRARSICRATRTGHHHGNRQRKNENV